MTKTKTVQIRLPLQVLATVREIAKLSGCTTTQVLNVMCAMHVAAIRERAGKQHD